MPQRQEQLEAFRQLWDGLASGAGSEQTPDVAQFLAQNSPSTPRDLAAILLLDQHRRWRMGEPRPVSEYLALLEGHDEDDELKIELLDEEIGYLEERDGEVDLVEFLSPFPDVSDKVRDRLGALASVSQSTHSHSTIRSRPSSTAPLGQARTMIGRYKVIRQLGRGSFGVVYLSHDSDLEREVAIKLPSQERLELAGGADSFLREARVVAGLDDSGIVPVYDVGKLETGECYVVSKYIRGGDLRTFMREHDISEMVAAKLVAKLARSLHQAHRKGLVHRDIKPGNVLMDAEGQPHIIDFGLALRDEEVTSGTTLVGTPAYMSPEQARGEGHRVDPRSDIYSLGVVLYELLTGKRPHRATSTHELLELVKHVEVRPPRQLDDSISRELDRICLRALARRRAERYSTALDLAEELEAFIEESSKRDSAAKLKEAGNSTKRGEASDTALASQSFAAETGSSESAGTESGKLRIVPKGLRSFDAADADFFLELIPGPRDRHGLPDSIRFWKQKLEETDPNKTFPVGLLYGPSGCGKSSLVKAGLIPRLAGHVIPFYFEAGEDTEGRILNALKRHFPQLESSSSISEAMATLRRDVLQPGQKCVLIIDQFEQWLNSWDGKLGPLTQALLQCDGGRVQAIIGVRDDFWMAATRLMRELEVRLVEGENSAAVDLFGERHAQNVLTAFGRAYGGLPARRSETTGGHEAFVRHAVSDLAEDGKVVPVRLALFAQMLKNREWTSSTLYRLGGASGVGVTFLEEAFGQHAPPANRMHADAAKAVLDVLLPASGTNIRGRIQGRKKLLDASGYTDPREFTDLLRILDDELRLITPVDTSTTTDSVIANNPDSVQFYQLTHDFLVPSVRDWMNRRRQTSIAGRAELRLQERASVWCHRPEFRALPSLMEYLSIAAFTKRRAWTTDERKMMRSATNSYGILACLVMLAVLGFGFASRQFFGQMRATSFRDQLMLAETKDVPALLEQNEAYRQWWNPLLKQDLANDHLQPNQRKNVAMALLPIDKNLLPVLEAEIVAAEPNELSVLIDAMRDDKSEVASSLRKQLAADVKSVRLNAAAGLSLLGESLSDTDDAKQVAHDLIASPLDFSSYLPLLDFNAKQLVPWWLQFAKTEPDSQRNAAAIALNAYYEPSPQQLIDLIETCNAEQFQTVFPLIEKNRDSLLPLLKSRFDEIRHAPWPVTELTSKPTNEALARRIQAGHGALHPAFGFATWLPLDEVEPLISAMAKDGYRPTRLRPFTTKDGVYASLLWVRDEQKWEWAYDLTGDEVRDLADQYGTKDLLPCDVAGYITSDGEQRFAAIWEARRNKGERREFYFGKPAKESIELQKVFAGRGLRATTQHFYTLPRAANETVETSVHHDMVWSVDAEHVDEFYFDSFSEDEFAVTSQAYDCPIDVCLTRKPEGDGHYGGVWVMVDRNSDRKILSGLSLTSHQIEAKRFATAGYRPVTVTAAELDGGRRIAASIWLRPKTTPEQQSQFAREQGNIAAALIRLGQLPRVIAKLRVDCDPDLRTELEHVPYSHGCAPGSLIDALETEHETRTRQTLLLALGDFPLNAIPVSQRDAAIRLVSTIHEQDADASIHAAAAWCLNRWGKAIQLANKPIDSGRNWYLNPIGQLMVVIDLTDQAIPFVAGCHRGEIGAKWRERTYSVWIKRRFAVAAHETQVEHFSRFAREVPEAAFVIRENDPPAMAQNRVNWFQAVRYCNWLSEQEGIREDQWCYEINDDGTFALAEGYLTKTGYRLPSEAEWEYCCRSGTRDTRYFGDSSYRLSSYAWFEQNSGQRVNNVGMLKPNALGLFDTLGNVGEWCQEKWLGTLKRNNKKVNIDHEDGLPAERDYMRITKGGTFSEVASDIRSADRTGIFPYAGSDSTGFRVVRTLP